MAENAREKGPWAVLLAVLALLGIRGLTTESAAPRQEEKAGQHAAPQAKGGLLQADAGEEIAGCEQPLRGFETVSPGKTAAPDRLPDVAGWDIEALIACVPDPVRSSSGHRFDALIDAIQRAAEMQGYVLDRYYYPWAQARPPANAAPLSGPIDVVAHKESSGKDARDSKHRFLLRISPKRKNQEKLGLLLFRSPSASADASTQEMPGCGPPPQREPLDRTQATGPRLLLVFLVGETATAGLDKSALAEGLRFLSRLPSYRKKGVFRILGPYFSGSQTSLERVLQWAGGPDAGLHATGAPARPSFCIVSGSATSIVKDRFKALAPAVDVHFQATIVPERRLLSQLLHYANLASIQCDEHGEKCLHFKDRFAVLYESNTIFGKQSILEPGPDNKAAPLLFPFPLHISEIRGAYQQAPAQAGGDLLHLPSFGSQLRLPLGRDSSSDDTEPSLDPAMTAVMSERTLNAMLNTIAHERLHYVLILATDIKDTLFLARLVRQHCPDCRLLLTGSDLLLGHPDFSAELRGSIVASTYPLYSRDQLWSPPFNGAKRRIIFSSHQEQGYYNATLVLLEGDPEHLLTYGPPFPRLLNAGLDPYTPPTWISIVGQNGLYPVAVYPRETRDQEDYVFTWPGPPRQKAEFVPIHAGMWIVPVLAVLFLLFYLVVSYLRVLRRHDQWQTPGPTEEDPDLVKLFWPPRATLPYPAGRRHGQRLYMAVCFASVLTLYGYLAFIWLIPVGHSYFVDNSPVVVRPLGWIMPVVLLLLPLGLLLAVGVFRMQALLATVLDGMIKAPVVVLLRLLLRMGSSASPTPLDRASAPEHPRPPLLHLLWHHFPYLFSLALLLVLASYLVRNGRPPRWPGHGELLFFFDRATSMASGVSPVVPVLLLGLAFLCWGYVQLKRLYLLRYHSVPYPCPTLPTFDEVGRRHEEVVTNLWSPQLALGGPFPLLLLVALFFVFCRLANYFVPAVEDVFSESILLLALTVLVLLIVYGLLYLLRVWRRLRRLLLAIASLRLHTGFKHLPATLLATYGPYLSSVRVNRRTHLRYRQDQQDLLRREYRKDSNVRSSLQRHLPDYNLRALEQALSDTATDQPALTATARACLDVLAHVWCQPALVEQLLAAQKEPAAKEDQPLRRWLALARDFAASEMVAYLAPFFAQVRNLIRFLALAPLALLFAIASYPFQPQRLLLLLAMTLLAIVTAAVLWIVIQIERDALVSRILKTTPHQLNFHWEFLSHLVIYATPLLGALVVMSSDASDFVHAWLDPLIQLAK